MRSLIAVATCLFGLSGSVLADEPAADTIGDVSECPLPFQGARVTASKVPDGVVLDFKNPNRDQLGHMRDQLREVAILLEQRSTQQQTASFDEPVDFPPVDLAVKDIVLGARVTVRAGRFRDIPAIRNLAFGFVRYWKQSPCAETLVSAR